MENREGKGIRVAKSGVLIMLKTVDAWPLQEGVGTPLGCKHVQIY